MTEDGFVDRVSAVVDSSFGSPMPAQAIAVFRDDAGSILGGFRQPIEPLGHGEVSIEIESRETIEGVAGVEVYLVPDALT